MKVLPPLKNILGLKAITWNTEKHTFVSPSYQDFKWDGLGLVSAECIAQFSPRSYCDTCKRWFHEKGPTCWLGHPMREHTGVPDVNCSCGMYCSFRMRIINGYTRNPISPILLVEAYGRHIIGDAGVGWKSKQVLVRAVMLPSGSTGGYQSDHLCHVAAMQAGDFFQVPLLPEQTLLASMDLWNIKRYPDWQEWYKPESSIVREMPVDQILEKLEVYL